MTTGSDHGGAPGRWLVPLGWGAFLACSWTWCIGMFLPVLLVRDFGLWGFLVFAAPNVLGAAAMGWVLWADGASERMVARHTTAMVWFTSATLGFHIFWLAWLAGSGRAWLGVPAWTLGVGALAGVAVGAGAGLAAWGKPARWGTLAGPVTLAFSLIALAVLVATDGVRIAGSDPAVAAMGGLQAPEELLWLAPVTAFGFALCPYLDLTFHRARQALAPPQAKLAFTAGFGALFAAMILLTLLYSGWLAGPVSGGPATGAPTLVALVLSGHIAAQATFTCLAHASALALHLPPRGSQSSGWRVLLLWILAVGPAAAALALTADRGLWGLSTGELIYRSFMGLYGLAFPAYVWLVVIPTRGDTAPPPGAPPASPTGKLVVWAGAVTIAAPLFGAGFLARQSHWLVAGMAVVLGARFFVWRLSGGSRRATMSE